MFLLVAVKVYIGQGQTRACVFLRSAPSVDPLPRILLHSEWILGDDDDQLYWKETYLSGRVRKWLEWKWCSQTFGFLLIFFWPLFFATISAMHILSTDLVDSSRTLRELSTSSVLSIQDAHWFVVSGVARSRGWTCEAKEGAVSSCETIDVPWGRAFWVQRHILIMAGGSQRKSAFCWSGI